MPYGGPGMIKTLLAAQAKDVGRIQRRVQWKTIKAAAGPHVETCEMHFISQKAQEDVYGIECR